MRVEKSWGYEEILYNGAYCCKRLVYTRPIASSLHKHLHKHETFVVATGVFELDSGQMSAPLRMASGDSVVLPPGTFHRIRCIEPGFIVEASTRDDSSDCERLIPSETVTESFVKEYTVAHAST